LATVNNTHTRLSPSYSLLLLLRPKILRRKLLAAPANKSVEKPQIEIEGGEIYVNAGA